MTAMGDSLAPWLALVLIAASAACAVAAATTRSLVILALSLWACAAFATTALLCLSESTGALALALFAAGLAPALLLATLSLSARAVKGPKRKLPYLTIAGGLCVIGVLIWGLPDLASAARQQRANDDAALYFLSVTVFAGIAALVGVLGFGERGALEKFMGRPEQ
ncbi:MAG: hypothetical protein NW206_04440 [Hyphomonadaceae bacterium]|nr:hypothetical protein [Hyphomonadaceae bacterium]